MTWTGGLAIPSKFAQDVRAAKEGKQLHQRTGEIQALEAAVSAWSHIINDPEFATTDVRFRLYVFGNAGEVFWRHFRIRSRINDLGHAILLWRQAVDLTAPDSPDLPIRLSNLGIALSDRYEQTAKPEDLAEAVSLFQRVVHQTPQDSPDLPARLVNLGNILRTRYECTGDVEDLEESIRVIGQAVNLSPPDAVALPERLNNFGTSLKSRYLHTGRLEDLEEAIRVTREAVSLSPPDSPDLPAHLNNLGLSLRERSVRLGRLEDLAEAIQVARQAITFSPQSSLNQPALLNNLGLALRDHYIRTGRLEDLDEAIRVTQEAVKVSLPGARGRPALLNNLGNAFRTRYARTSRKEDLEEAIHLSEDAVSLSPSGSPERPALLNNLATSLNDRYMRTRDVKDLEETIRVYQQAVQTTPPDSPDLPSRLNNLGASLRDRYLRTGHPDDLEEAISVTRRAVSLSPADSLDLPNRLNNLGACVSDRCLHTGSQQDQEEAIHCYRLACERGAIYVPQIVLDASRSWGRWAIQRRDWNEIVEAYTHGVNTGRILFRRQVRRADKENWLADLQEMAPAAAYAYAKLGRAGSAVLMFESGRSQLLAEVLEQNRRDLERLPAELYARYQAVMTERRRLEQPDFSAYGNRLAEIEANEQEFAAVIEAIRELPGYADYLTDLTFSQIQAATQPEVPLVYLLSTAVGGLALIVFSQNSGVEKNEEAAITTLWLDQLTDARLHAEVYGPTGDPSLGYLGAYRRWREHRIRDSAVHAAWDQALDGTTAWLWDAVMAPVVDCLNTAGATEAVLIPGGLLGLLPLHAAWTPDATSPNGRRYALDTITFHYAPAALVLSNCQERMQRIAADSVLAIDNPDGSLRFAGQEVDAILGHFAPDCRHRLAGQAATPDAVLQAVPSSQVLHFATHGTAGWDEPLQSGLLLAGGASFTLDTLLGLKLPATRLAVLSACETGVPGTKLPDEVIGLPAGLLQAGVAGVAASLWAVEDLSTALLMEHFYKEWLGEGLAPAAALCGAQRWLRDVTQMELREYQTSDGRAMRPPIMRQESPSEKSKGALDDRPYSHPHYWAAFTFSGA